MSSQIFDWKQFSRHSFSLFGGITVPNESTARLSLAERWTITEIRRQSNSVLTYSLLTDVLQEIKYKKRLELLARTRERELIKLLNLTFRQIK